VNGPDVNEICRASNGALYWPERLKLMQAWADMLDEFKRVSVASSRAS
jgi:hypothetical protein